MNERTIHLPGGDRVAVRTMDLADAAAVLAAFERLSPSALRSRFFSPAPRLTAAMAADLTLVDDQRIVLVAVDGAGDVIGEARAVRRRRDPQTAEVAVTVVDGHQRRGVGSALLRVLGREARRAGIERLAGDVLVDNVAAQALVARSGGTTSITEPGVLSFEIALGEPAARSVGAANGALRLAS